MSTVATAILLVLALVALNQVRAGTVGPWLRSKVLNAADPNRPGPSAAATAATTPGAGQTGGWLTPTSGSVSSPFGRRDGRDHEGIDFAAPAGTPVRAARAGSVTWAGGRGTAGNAVIIEHSDGWSSRYYHLSTVAVRRGESVKAGAAIGEVGSTGRSTGPHLHFEIRRGGTPVDPAPYVGAAVGVS